MGRNMILFKKKFFLMPSLLICHIIPLSQSTTSLRGSRTSLLSPTQQDFSWVEDEEEEEYEEEEEEEVESSPSWFLEDLHPYLFRPVVVAETSPELIIQFLFSDPEIIRLQILMLSNMTSAQRSLSSNSRRAVGKEKRRRRRKTTKITMMQWQALKSERDLKKEGVKQRQWNQGRKKREQKQSEEGVPRRYSTL